MKANIIAIITGTLLGGIIISLFVIYLDVQKISATQQARAGIVDNLTELIHSDQELISQVKASCK